MKNIIVAYDQNRGIGAENDLLWLRDLPADLKHFRDITMGHAVIMGRKTYQSIGKPLVGRQNIVVSRQELAVDGVVTAKSLEEAFGQVAPDKEVFIIGGGEVFHQVMTHADKIYATEVQAAFPAASIFFPVLDDSIWKETARERHHADERNMYDYDFVEYERIMSV